MAEPLEDYATTLKRKSTLVRNISQKGDDGAGVGVGPRPLSRSSSKFKGTTAAVGASAGSAGGGADTTGEDIRIPMCGLVIGGDRFTLRQVYCSIMQNQCPMVVAKVR